jgi:hypothetical protein
MWSWHYESVGSGSKLKGKKARDLICWREDMEKVLVPVRP